MAILNISAQQAISISTLVVVTLTTLPLLYRNGSILKRRQSYEPIGSLYEDEDGVATKESQQKYSVRIYKHLIAFLCVTGAALALTDAIQNSVNKNDVKAVYLWIYVFAWVSFQTSGIRRIQF